MWKTHSAGVDWLTTTSQINTKECEKSEDVALTTLSEALRDGHKLKPQNRLGFSGMGAGHVFVGRSSTHQMVQVGGNVAHRFALRLREENEDAKVTRIDFEVTLRDDQEDERRARAAFKALEEKDFRTAQGRQTVASIISRPRNGDTLYIGSRVSESYCRFYNKSLESGGALGNGLWRCEREQKGATARMAWEAFCVSGAPTELCYNVVKAAFQDAGFCYELPDQGEVVRLETIRDVTDDERQQRWFREMISRTAQEQEARHGEGHVERLLGLKSATKPKSL